MSDYMLGLITIPLVIGTSLALLLLIDLVIVPMTCIVSWHVWKIGNAWRRKTGLRWHMLPKSMACNYPQFIGWRKRATGWSDYVSFHGEDGANWYGPFNWTLAQERVRPYKPEEVNYP